MSLSPFLFLLIPVGGLLYRIRGGWLPVPGDTLRRLSYCVPSGFLAWFMVHSDGGEINELESVYIGLAITVLSFTGFLMGWGAYLGMGRGVTPGRAGPFDCLFGAYNVNWTFARRWMWCVAGWFLRGLYITMPAGIACYFISQHYLQDCQDHHVAASFHHAVRSSTVHSLMTEIGVSGHTDLLMELLAATRIYFWILVYGMAGVAVPWCYELGYLTPSTIPNFTQGTPMGEFYTGSWLWFVIMTYHTTYIDVAFLSIALILLMTLINLLISVAVIVQRFCIPSTSSSPKSADHELVKAQHRHKPDPSSP